MGRGASNHVTLDDCRSTVQVEPHTMADYMRMPLRVNRSCHHSACFRVSVHVAPKFLTLVRFASYCSKSPCYANIQEEHSPKADVR